MSIRKRAAAALAALLGLCVLLAILVMACAPRTETADVAILMYHAFTEDEADTGSLCTPASEFARQLSALRDAGYTSVGYADLIEFVNGDGKLPEKPLLITIDDGYQNNLDLAAPLLEKYGFCANIAVIGVSIGHTTYKDTGVPIMPHFSLEDARPWIARGVLTVTTHSYDMHQVAAVDGAGCRRGVLQMRGEAEPDYIAALTQDYTRAQEQLTGLPGTPLPVFTYPNGAYSELSERVLQALGVQVTVTTEGGANRLVKGEPETLRLLHRIHVWRGTKPDMLLSRIDGALLQAVVEKGEYIKTQLQGAKGVKAVTGLGLLIGVLPEARLASDVAEACEKHGVLLLTEKDNLCIAPALNIPMEELDAAIAVVKQELAAE